MHSQHTKSCRSTVRWFSGFVVVALVAASCSSQQAVEPPHDSLSEYLEFQDEQQQRDWSQSRWTAVEEMVVGCMSEEGFNYFPEPFEFISFPSIESLADREYVAEAGFGMTKGLRLQDSPETAPSRNDAEVEGLPSGDERTAWLTQRAECAEQAQSEVNSAWIEPQQVIREARGELEQRIAADPTMVEMRSEWSRCVRGQGYEADSRDDLFTIIFAAIKEAEDAGLTSRDLDELVAFEQEIALVDFDCWNPMREARSELRRGYEKSSSRIYCRN